MVVVQVLKVSTMILMVVIWEVHTERETIILFMLIVTILSLSPAN